MVNKNSVPTMQLGGRETTARRDETPLASPRASETPSRLGFSQNRSKKEADKINIKEWPRNVGSYRDWKLSVVDEIAASSTNPSQAVLWITSMKKATYEDLADSGFPDFEDAFETLDAKLSSALTRILKG